MNCESIFEILSKELPKYNPNIPKRDTKDNILLDVLCTVINKLITNGDKLRNDRREFYPPNRKPPTIGIDAYLARLLKYSPCSKECFVMSLVYIDRFLKQCDLIVNSMNIHRLVITSLLISTKYLDDIFYNNEFYSQVGGISLREMNGLEVVFLSMMDYTVNCSLDEFNKYAKEVEKAKNKMELDQQLSASQSISPDSLSIQPNNTSSSSSSSNNSTNTTSSSNKNNDNTSSSSSNKNIINNNTSTSTTNNNASSAGHQNNASTASTNTYNTNIKSSSSSSSSSSLQNLNANTNIVYNTNNNVNNNNSNNSNNTNNSTNSPLKSSIPIQTRRRGSCDYSSSMQTNKDKPFATTQTGWVA